jgi:pimeloyl-ACP methyl ester carboxylesterase
MHQLYKKLSGLGLIGVLCVTFIGIGGFATPVARAQAAGNDVQYESTLDYSPTNVLINETGYLASSTYNCSIATLACTGVPADTTTLQTIPGSLSGLSYFLSPDSTQAITTTYVPGSSPVEKLSSIQNGALVYKQTIPTLNALITYVTWASNGTTIFFSESDGSTQEYNTNTNTLRTLTANVPAGASYVTVSADGHYIAYYLPAVVSSGVRTFGVIDTVADKAYTMTENISYWDLLTEGTRLFAFSPDSTKLLYLDDRSGYETLYEVTLADLAANASSATSTTNPLMGTEITSKPYTIMDMQWETNSTIAFAANRSNPLQWSLYELNLNTYAINDVTDWFSYDEPMEKEGFDIIFQTADANGRLTKIYNFATKTLSSFNVPGVTDSIVGSPGNSVVQAGGLYGVYMAPNTGATAAPSSTLLVWLHGGPDRSESIEYNSYMSYGGYDWVLNQLQTAGVPVLKLDYPGSIGHGVAFAESIKDGIGTTDASSTIQAITDFASAHGYKNIYVMGNSYGGYLALKLLVSYPNQIKGAYSLSGVTDWDSLLTNVPSSIFSIDFNGAPNPTNQALYDAASIINNLSAITTQKVILIQGNADTEVPYQQSVLLNQALLTAGKTVDYTTLQGENHIYENPSSFTLVCNKAMEFVGLADSPLCTLTN